MSSYSALSFRDVLCGYVRWEGLLPDHETSFAEALKDFSFFPESRTLRKHEGPEFVLYTNSYLEDIYATPEDFAVCVGFASGLSSATKSERKIASHFAQKKHWEAFDFNDFLDSRFAGIFLDRKEKTLRLGTDFFGKRKIFYKIVNGTLYFSTEFQTLTKIFMADEKMDRQTLRNFLSLGVSLGERTLSDKIKSVPLQGFVEFKGIELQVRRFQKSETVLPPLDPQKVFREFKAVLNFWSRT